MRRRVLLAGLVVVSACGASHAATTGPGVWACPDGAPASTVVHRYTHAAAAVGAERLPAGATALLCGTSGYGFRHILRRHEGDWSHVASRSDWSTTADAAVAAALGQPERVGYRASNNTFCYSHALPDGEVTTVVIRPSDGAIITAYPGHDQCAAQD